LHLIIFGDGRPAEGNLGGLCLRKRVDWLIWLVTLPAPSGRRGAVFHLDPEMEFGIVDLCTWRAIPEFLYIPDCVLPRVERVLKLLIPAVP
jgi:hypothetical protein